MVVDYIRNPRQWLRAGYLAYFGVFFLGSLGASIYTVIRPPNPANPPDLWLLCPGFFILGAVSGVVGVAILSYLVGSLGYRLTRRNKLPNFLAAMFSGLGALPVLAAFIWALFS